MKDLDFDELDKAVNSLMTNANKSEPPSSEGEVRTIDIPPTLDENAIPSFSNLNQAVAKIEGVSSPDTAPVANATPVTPVAAVPAPSSAMAVPVPSSLAARRRGRFMDVVHPSSDMTKTSVPARPVSRQGMTIGRGEPSAPVVAAQPNPPVEEQPVPEVVQPAPETNSSPANEWPDPLEMADFKPEAPKASISDNLEADLMAEAEKTDDNAPLTSPFLSDAKVEKRPLGGSAIAFAGSDLADQSTAPAAGDGADAPKDEDHSNSQLPASPTEQPVQLPEELQGDLMAIESDTHMGLPKTEETHPTVEPESHPDTTVSEAKTEVEAPREVSAGPISIPQQYREEPSTTPEESGTIYDTDSYHQPLSHPAKKKSGWLWVVAIVVILLLGAAGGAALYFLGVV
jgi:hypothetical protein